MKTVLIIFNEKDSSEYFDQREHTEVHSVKSNDSGTILTITLLNSTVIQYPWSRIRFVRVS